MNKPPIGIMPRYILEERRLFDIIAAVERYIDDKQPIPIEWIEEYNDLIARVKE